MSKFIKSCYIKYMQFFVCQLYFNKGALKLESLQILTELLLERKIPRGKSMGGGDGTDGGRVCSWKNFHLPSSSVFGVFTVIIFFFLQLQNLNTSILDKSTPYHNLCTQQQIPRDLGSLFSSLSWS